MEEQQHWAGYVNTMRRCDNQAADEGLSGLAFLFRSRELYKEALANDVGAPPLPSKPQEKITEDLIEALQSISDNHDDPRELAKSVLLRLLK